MLLIIILAVTIYIKLYLEYIFRIIEHNLPKRAIAKVT